MVIDMNMLRRNQVIIYTFALMLVAAGYLNYTSNISDEVAETSLQEVAQDEIVNESIEESNIESGALVENTDSSNVENNEIQGDNSDANTQTDTKNKVASEKEEKESNIGDATLVSSNDVVTDYFAKSKLDRDSMYSQMLETYEKILNSNNSLETQKQSASQEIKKINDIKNSIMICENLIRTKGFENCVVFVNGDSVSVIIGANSLTKEQIAQIQNIVSRELEAKIEDIHISTK